MNPDEACQTAQRLIDTLSCTPFLLNNTNVTVAASVGISIRSGAPCDLSALMLEADRALYDAKLTGRSRAVLATVA
ncbi:MAG: diguanylate cyclase [Oxalobacteraceae bacterium]|nr:MAG: diguanylate cyclase [Oxalobacteraceae bacterium]